jgi:hypothetical protein
MGNVEPEPERQKIIKNLFPKTDEEKKMMKKPYIVKPCPDMYLSS